MESVVYIDIYSANPDTVKTAGLLVDRLPCLVNSTECLYLVRIISNKLSLGIDSEVG